MTRLYQLMTEPQFSRCSKPAKYKKLLFALCFFHSVLLERKKFLQLGWNIIYGFNDSDFEVRATQGSLIPALSPSCPISSPERISAVRKPVLKPHCKSSCHNCVGGWGLGLGPCTGVRELAEPLSG